MNHPVGARALGGGNLGGGGANNPLFADCIKSSYCIFLSVVSFD